MAENDKAHEDFLTVGHFKMLKDEDSNRIFSIGESVAALLPYVDGIQIVYGLIFNSEYVDTTGSRYDVVTREGVQHARIAPDFLVHI